MTFERIRDRVATLKPGTSQRIMAERAVERWAPAISELDQVISEGRYVSLYDLSEKHRPGALSSWSIRRCGLINYLENTGFLGYYDDKLECVVRRKISKAKQPIREKLMEYLLTRKRSPRDAIMHWIPVILELDRAISRNTFISISAAAMKHNNLGSSCRIFLKRVEIYDYYQNKFSEVRKNIEKGKIRRAQIQQKKRSYEKDQHLAQLIFDLETGLTITETANKNNTSFNTLYKTLARFNLLRKYKVFKTYGEEKKQEALSLRQQGLTIRAVASQVGVSKSTVALWDK